MRTVTEIHKKKIHPNRYQPRLTFDEDALQELADSIKENGLIQPVVVRRDGFEYEIIAGERRFRACQLAGLTNIPCVVMSANEEELAQMALVENIQRENLNAIEEAKAYVEMMRLAKLTQQELADKVGKKQSTIANKIRLLNLSEDVQSAIVSREISERHARAMLNLTSEQQSTMLKNIVKNNLTVAQTEEKVLKFKEKKKEKPTTTIFTKNTRLARNTIMQSVDVIKKCNIDVVVEEQDKESEYVMTIRIKK